MEQAIWHLPLAALNQMVLWDELCNGRTARWIDSGTEGAQSIDAMLTHALTGAA